MRRNYKVRPNDNTMKIFSYIIKHFYDEDKTVLNTARQIYAHTTPLRNMTDVQNRIQHLKDSPHVVEDEVYMKLEEALNALEHLCSQDDNIELWEDGIGIIDNYLSQINFRVMNKETYESLKKTSIEGILAEILTKKTEINPQPC
ncbi:MAG: hypothetical protein QXR60_01615 [Candidatus Nanoarchaeia archaeon]